MEQRQIHVLKAPLKIATNDQARPYYLLPAGTTLYFDQSMPEGFDRYFLYVNVEGVPLALTRPEPPDMVAPLTAYPLDREELSALLARYPLSRDDLARILHGSSLTRNDLIELLNTYQP